MADLDALEAQWETDARGIGKRDIRWLIDRVRFLESDRARYARSARTAEAEVERLRDGIRQHRSKGIRAPEPPSDDDLALWALLDDRTETT